MSPSRTRAPRRRTTRFIETRAALLFISPWIIGFLVFTAWPVINSAYLSLTDYDVINDPSYVGFDNYVQLFEDPKVGLALWNTFVFAVLSVPAHLVVALGLALLLNGASKATGFFRTAFFLPKMTPPVAIGILLLLLFNGQDGLINAFLGVFGIDGPAWTTDPNWVKPALVLMNLWTVGSSVVIILAALRGVPQELYDSALVDGAGWWKRTLRITVPMISPTLFFLFIVDSINALQSFTEAYTAFFGAGNTTYSNDAALFYAIYLFQQAFEFLHMGYASALAWLLFIVIMAITGVQFVVTRRFVHYEGGNP
ncbi:carbohydrate ABC transporter permease [Nonomuraea fuscirosea]|jgi:multiple sugar transport system permease protein|uniref:Multiple sugar transport system permease protein n=1 Tax=Nonomuraea fuscirosea TaxID=1291556 RepID=A0A2T0NC66_9ACTN|nr:sugar ABC transporter permease [Nonomuraea fuscirosea]PRX70466.1 multiple sugar transport system permease protein [Nonomuraea fuscirosea]WSA54797.1 sugar ABC transporter permease [Nonomuraea fuscirosea]